ncbi:hypothetical protein KFL_000940030 [Klebsormidium nitens]|uniref:protein disulfide-isomerase n=1 Tax=Klebsormidium nitens TaxID=105231 RepID=A0A1Y1HUS6_KLENI|nr:hypothetical protein KFL_000940030 [Klebsormidium nitens]|eukprot:GAQ81893.1 hypothetical protein KFL_000940030 [Klebsormidium nitens]
MADACRLRQGVVCRVFGLLLLALIRCDAVAPDAAHAVEQNSSRGVSGETAPRFEWVSKEELTALVREEEYALCVAQVPWCGLSRKFTRDIEQMLQADPDRWPGLRLCKINGHKEPQLAASHGLHRQWPAVTVYLRGRAISYPFKLVARPLLEALESVMKMRREDVPIRTIGSFKEWRGVLQETEEVIVLYDRCGGGKAGVRLGGDAVRWQNGSVLGGQTACSGSCLRGIAPFQGGCETAVISSKSRTLNSHAGAVVEHSAQKKSGSARFLVAENGGVSEGTSQCLAPQSRPPVLTETCPVPDVPSSLNHPETGDQPHLGDAEGGQEVDDPGYCSQAEAVQAALIRAEAEDLAWRLLLLPSKLLLLRVTDPQILEAALRKDVVERRESVDVRGFGGWIRDLLRTLIPGGESALSLNADFSGGRGFEEGSWTVLGRSLLSRFARFWIREESSAGSQGTMGSGRGRAFDEPNERNVEDRSLLSEASQSRVEGLGISRISKFPWLVLVQTQGRGPPRGFYGGANLTAFLEGVPFPLLEELKYDEIGGAFQSKLPVVLLFVDMYSRSEGVRNASRRAIRELRAVGERMEGFSVTGTGLAEEGSLLEGLEIEGLEGSGEKTADEGLVAGEEAEFAGREAKGNGEESSEDVPWGGGETGGTVSDRSDKEVESKADEVNGCEVEEKSESGSNSKEDGKSATGNGSGADRGAGNAEKTSEKQVAESESTKADGIARNSGVASSVRSPAESRDETVESLPAEAESAGLQKEVVSGGSSVVALGGGGEPGFANAASGLQGGNTQALFEQLAARLKGMPAGSTFEIEVHEAPQQGLAKQAALGASEKQGRTEGGKTGKFKYVYMDGEEALPRRMGVDIDLGNGVGVPALAIIDADNGAFYFYPPERPLSQGAIEEFLLSSRGGTLQPNLRSERAPWLPPRLRKGARAAFPLPPVSAADFSARVFGQPAKRTASAESVESRGEGDLEGASESESNRDQGRGRRPDRGAVKPWSLFTLFARRQDSAGSAPVTSPPGIKTRSAGPTGGGFLHSDALPGPSSLVLFTTNWCGFCQRAEVVLQEVALLVESGQKLGVSGTAGSAGAGVLTPKRSGASEAGVLGEEGRAKESMRLRVFRMDCDENDCATVTGLQILEYPSLVLFAAGNETAPAIYRGSFVVQDILTFLSRNKTPIGKQKLRR